MARGMSWLALALMALALSAAVTPAVADHADDELPSLHAHLMPTQEVQAEEAASHVVPLHDASFVPSAEDDHAAALLAVNSETKSAAPSEVSLLAMQQGWFEKKANKEWWC